MQGISGTRLQAPDLCSKFVEVRGYTERLCEPLEIEDYIPQPIVDVSPAKWNIAHTTWFFEEMVLKKHGADYETFDEIFPLLFNSYYNTIGKRTARDQRGDISRPTVKRVFEYRKYVDEHMLALIEQSPKKEVFELIELGLNHEQQHQELLLTDLKYMLSVNPMLPAYREDFAPEDEVESGSGYMIEITAGLYEIGFSGGGFCFDNELGRHKVYLDELSIADRLVTNGEFMEFIDAGGYSDFRLWHAEGWDWVNENELDAPLYWKKRLGGWSQFTLGGQRDVIPEAPLCHVSFYEASAFAEWKGMRLPTEAEWEVASERFEWGKRWEWTGSAYLPYPGFTKPHGALGEYNGKFMINQMVLRGASVVTPKGHSRPTYRNFFHPHLRWQFTGIRLAQKPTKPMDQTASPEMTQFAEDVLTGLASQPKALSSKYFYDDEGSRLFQEIMKLPEYYLTGCETEIFSQQTDAIFRSFSNGGGGFDVVELGAGDGTKTAVLIDYFLKENADITYAPIDISREALDALDAKFTAEFPDLKIDSLNGDYLHILQSLKGDGRRRKVLFFLGSNIGNFTRAASVEFFRRLRGVMNANDLLFIGFDLQKDPHVIANAYDDASGVTAAFNLNLLTRINRELGGDFDLYKFTHYANYRPNEGSARSFLISREKQTVNVSALGRTFEFDQWEAVFMEISQKYNLNMIDSLAGESGFAVKQNFFDGRRYYCDSLWTPVAR